MNSLDALLYAFSASSDGVVASSSGVEYFSTVASDSPARARNRMVTEMVILYDIQPGACRSLRAHHGRALGLNARAG